MLCSMYVIIVLFTLCDAVISDFEKMYMAYLLYKYSIYTYS